MPKTKIGLIQMSMSSSRENNLGKASRLVSDAANKGAEIVCLPELFNTRYFPQEEKNSSYQPEKIPNETSETLSNLACKEKVVLIGGSIYEKKGNKRYNSSMVFDDDGKILGIYRKVHIPNDPGFYEQNYFDAGDEYKVFKTKYGKIGVLICFDQWYPEPARILKLMGAEIIFYPTAIGRVKGIEQVEGDWHKAWESVQRGHAISNSIAIASVNRVGREGDTTFWGGSFLSDQFGGLLLRAGSKEGVFVASCDFTKGKDIDSGWGFLKSRRPKTYSKLLAKNEDRR